MIIYFYLTGPGTWVLSVVDPRALLQSSPPFGDWRESPGKGSRLDGSWSEMTSPARLTKPSEGLMNPRDTARDLRGGLYGPAT